jgi:hypothetical protein
MRSSFGPGMAFLYFSLLKTVRKRRGFEDWPPIKIRLHKLCFSTRNFTFEAPSVRAFIYIKPTRRFLRLLFGCTRQYRPGSSLEAST